MTDTASWEAVERKARLAGNGLCPCPEAKHRGRLLPGSPAESYPDEPGVAYTDVGQGREQERKLCSS